MAAGVLKKIGAKLGGGIVVLFIGVAVAVMMAFQITRDYHHTTVGAWFPDDTQVILARPVFLPFNTDRTIDIWRVALKDGKATSYGEESVGAMHEIRYLGVAQQRMWFWSKPSETIISRGARSASDRYDVKGQLRAHPTLSLSFDLEAMTTDGPIIEDQRSVTYRVQANGTFVATDRMTYFMRDSSSMRDNNGIDAFKYPELMISYSAGPGMQHYQALPYKRAGVMLGPDGKPIRPREGGWLVVGEQLTSGFDQEVKHVVVKLDDKGKPLWQLPLLQAFADTSVDDFSMGPHYRVTLLAMHTTPQRVWVVAQIGIAKSGNHETRLIEIDATRGSVVRSIVPRL